MVFLDTFIIVIVVVMRSCTATSWHVFFVVLESFPTKVPTLGKQMALLLGTGLDGMTG